MRNCNRSADYQRNVESINELFARNPCFRALFEVISDAIIAAQNDRAGQAHQLLRSFIQRAVFIGLGIERKEPLDAQMTTAQQLLVHLSAIAIKIVHSEILSIYVSSYGVGFWLTVP